MNRSPRHPRIDIHRSVSVVSQELKEGTGRSLFGNPLVLPAPDGGYVHHSQVGETRLGKVQFGPEGLDIEVGSHDVGEYAKRKLCCQREMHTQTLQNACMTEEPFDDRPEAAKRLEQARKARGFATAKDATEYFGWNYVSYTQHESGDRGLSRAASKYADGLRVSVAWLQFGEGKGPDGQTIAPEPARVALVPGRELISSSQKMPVYAAAMGGDGHIIISFEQIDEIKRPAELENVKGGYGLLIKGSSMVPALWEGDMALVNPHLPPAREFNHIFYHEPPNSAEVEAIVKQLDGWNDREWTLTQWQPHRTWKESRQVWRVCHRVVGKYDRR